MIAAQEKKGREKSQSAHNHDHQGNTDRCRIYRLLFYFCSETQYCPLVLYCNYTVMRYNML